MKGCQLLLGAQRGAAGSACPSFAMRTTKGPGGVACLHGN